MAILTIENRPPESLTASIEVAGEEGISTDQVLPWRWRLLRYAA